MGNGATAAAFKTQSGLTHEVVINSATATYNLGINSSIDAKKAINGANATSGLRIFVDTWKLGSKATEEGASTTLRTVGWSNIDSTNTS